MSDKKPVGRPFKFNPIEFDLAWQQYFQYIDDTPWIKYEAIKGGERAGQLISIPNVQPYTEVGFCAFHNLGEKYITELQDTLSRNIGDDECNNREESQELSNILTQARARCKAQKFAGAAVGAFNANIIARDLGLIDKKEVDNQVTVNKPLIIGWGDVD